jgi:hypothetical protein
MQQHWLHSVWPFVGGGAAIVMVAILLTTDTFRSNTTLCMNAMQMRAVERAG